MEPKSQPTLTPEQRSTDWFVQRLGRVTASRAGDTMEYYAPTKTDLAKAKEWHVENKTDEDWAAYLELNNPFEFCLSAGIELKEKEIRRRYREGIVAERLTGLQSDPEPFNSYDMKWGVANESIAKTVYQMEYRRLLTDAPFVEHPTLMAGVSPDGWVVEPTTGEIIACAEIKCLRSANHLYKAILLQKMPAEHIPQVQMQMWITGMPMCVFIAYDSRVPEGLKIFTTEVARDDMYLRVLVANIERFLKECDNDFKHFWARVKNKPNLEKGVVNRNENVGRTTA